MSCCSIRILENGYTFLSASAYNNKNLSSQEQVYRWPGIRSKYQEKEISRNPIHACYDQNALLALQLCAVPSYLENIYIHK